MPRISYASPLILGVMAFATSCGVEGNNPSNVSPNAEFTGSCTLLACAFADSSSDPDGQVTAYAWNFGDGSNATSQNSSHLYGSAGSYVVELTVTDNQGATGTLSQQVTVAAVPPTNIELSQTTFYFAARRWPQHLLYDMLEITSTGPGTLNWTASSTSSWLSVSPVSGTAPSPHVTVSVNTANLGPGGGIYHGAITIAAAGAANSPQTISVTLRLR
jgi:PKD repeat protein